MDFISKLKLKGVHPLLLINAPEGIKEALAAVIEVVDSCDDNDISQVLLFAEDKKVLDNSFGKINRRITDDTLIWIAYPKKSGSIRSDLTRDDGWEPLYEAGYEPVTLVAVDDDWSALRFKKSTAIKDKKRDVPMADRNTEGVDYINRTTTLPADVRTLMSKHTGLQEVFDSLSFSHRKEHLEAIAEAKKPETRLRRIEKMIEMLQKTKTKRRNNEL